MGILSGKGQLLCSKTTSLEATKAANIMQKYALNIQQAIVYRLHKDRVTTEQQ